MKPYEVFEFKDVGYQKLFHHQSWRIAILNYIDELEIENINYVEAHLETDEVFVLLSGCCTLIFAHALSGEITNFECIQMELNKVYKVPRGVYHACVLSKDGKVLIVEEENTCDHNSPRIYLDDIQKESLISCFEGEKHEL
jgi:cupin superfamily acireductone dioxygenase involved in methionine salvage